MRFTDAERRNIEKLCSRFHLSFDDLNVDFDEGSDIDGFSGSLLSRQNRRDIDVLRQLYLRNHFSKVSPSDEPKIPKIIHQVWLGSELPDQFAKYRENWQKHHPDWDVRLWTDDTIRDFDFKNRDLFDSVDCYGMKVNLLRNEIVLRFGGLYIDVDYDCFKPFDIFHHCYDLYGTIRVFPMIHLQKLPFWALKSSVGGPIMMCTSLFGARAGHPFLLAYDRVIREMWGEMPNVRLALFEKLQTLRNPAARSLLWRSRRNAKIAFGPFNRTFVDTMSNSSSSDVNVALPATYFNPIDRWWGVYWNKRRPAKYWYYRALFGLKNGLAKKPNVMLKVRPHSFAHHDSQASWLNAPVEVASRWRGGSE